MLEAGVRDAGLWGPHSEASVLGLRTAVPSVSWACILMSSSGADLCPIGSGPTLATEFYLRPSLRAHLQYGHTPGAGVRASARELGGHGPGHGAREAVAPSSFPVSWMVTVSSPIPHPGHWLIPGGGGQVGEAKARHWGRRRTSGAQRAGGPFGVRGPRTRSSGVFTGGDQRPRYTPRRGAGTGETRRSLRRGQSGRWEGPRGHRARGLEPGERQWCPGCPALQQGGRKGKGLRDLWPPSRGHRL